MRLLMLRMVHVDDPENWHWDLSDAAGLRLATFGVSLDPGAPEYEGFVDLHRYLRLRAGSDGVSASHARLIAGIGEWMGRTVLGPIGRVLAERARRGPCTVVVRVPAQAGDVLERPLELSYVDGRPLYAYGVTFVYAVDAAALTAVPAMRPVSRRLRILAALSLPAGSTPLGLRRERQELVNLVGRLTAAGLAVDLRVLQYGVSRRELEAALAEPEGWDVVHYSGHGLAGVLSLEAESGGTEYVDAASLTRMLRLTCDRLSLVVLSACESAATALADSLRWLGVSDDPAAADAGRTRLPGVAKHLAEELGCAVVAMRYPLDDRFGISFTAALYEEMLLRGAPLAAAFRTARATSAGLPLSAAAPTLMGSPAADLLLACPPLDAPAAVVGDRAGDLPPLSPHFVGRVGQLARAGRVLGDDRTHTGVLFLGMAGAGKTSCAAELVHLYAHRFEFVVWYSAPALEADPVLAFGDLCLLLEARLPGLDVMPALTGAAHLESATARLRSWLATYPTLIVLDNLESLMTLDNGWADERWAAFVQALLSDPGRSRVVMTSRSRPATPAPRLLVEPVHALTFEESVLLARDMAHLGALIRGDNPHIDPDDGRALVRRTLEVVQGHPVLLHLADSVASVDPGALGPLLDEVAAAEDAHGTAVQAWVEREDRSLDVAEQVVFSFLCALEEPDRRGDIVDPVWARFFRRIMAPTVEMPAIEGCTRALDRVGLVEARTNPDDEAPVVYRIHPSVAAAGRALVSDRVRTLIDDTLAQFWVDAARDGVLNERGEGLSYLVATAGRHAVAYLLRLGQPGAAAAMLTDAIARSSATPDEISWYVAMLQRILDTSSGTADVGAAIWGLAQALQGVNPAVAVPRLRDLLVRAREVDDAIACKVELSLSGALDNAGRFQEALDLVEARLAADPEPAELTWDRANLLVSRLDILTSLRVGRETLDEGLDLLERIRTLPTGGAVAEGVNTWNIVERLLDACRRSAKDLEEWQLALDLNAERIDSKRRRGATDHDIARSRGNDSSSLIRLGRLDEAELVIRWCKHIFEEHGDHAAVGGKLSTLAVVEGMRGRRAAARQLEAEALRLKYLAPRPEELAVSHFNYGKLTLTEGTQTEGTQIEGGGHALAALAISYWIRSGLLDHYLASTARYLCGFPPGEEPVPSSFAELCATVETVEGVRFARLATDLAGDAVAAGLARVRVLLADPLDDARREADHYVATMDPLVELAAFARSDLLVAEAFDVAVVALEYFSPFQAVGSALRQAIGDGTDAAVTRDLSGCDRLLTLAIRDRRSTGPRGASATAAFRALDTILGGQITEFGRTLASFDPLVLAAADSARHGRSANGRLDAELRRLADGDWAKLVPRVRSIMRGERGNLVYAGLDALDRAVLRRVVAAVPAASGT